MDDLLTTKQVQEYLQVDRTTIYRMLNDGRLEGVKVGQQWRFPRSKIAAVFGGMLPSEDEKTTITPEDLPVHCVQVVQDVFAEVAGIGSVTTTKDGEMLTTISNSCQFCDLILNSESGFQACKKTWKQLATLTAEEEQSFFTCHAGLQYAYSRINIDGEFSALLIAGQFHLENSDLNLHSSEVQEMGKKHGIKEEELAAAAGKIPVLEKHIQKRIGVWLQNVAMTFGLIGSERAELMGRLNKIAEMTNLDQ